MRIVVFGATGGTGSQVVRQALVAGHEVTAVIRRSGALAAQQRLRVVVGAVDDMDVVENAVHGQDAVISALGTDRKGPTTVCTDAIGVIIEAMRTQHVARLLVVSAYGAAETHDRSAYSLILWAMKGDSMRDKESMEALGPRVRGGLDDRAALSVDERVTHRHLPDGYRPAYRPSIQDLPGGPG